LARLEIVSFPFLFDSILSHPVRFPIFAPIEK
jgi:hypothetical protein